MTTVSVVMPIYAPEPWQRFMTRCAIDTLRVTTELDYELIIVEAGGRTFENDPLPGNYVHFPEPTGNVTAEINAGLEVATGEVLVYTGTDVFTRPGWLEVLLETLTLPHCGAATLASTDLRHALGPMPRDEISEGIYGPFMAFRRGWRYDAVTFPCQFADSDLVARMYTAGLRSYRNYRVAIHHLNKQTLGTEANQAEFHEAKRRFLERHGGNPSIMVRALCGGQIV